MLAQNYPVTVACRVLGVARSSYYYQALGSPDEASLREEIKKTSAEWPRYGYRRITEQLRRGKWRVNRKRVQRLMREMSIQARIQRKQRRTTNSDDITYIHLHNSFVYLAVIMDVFTRGVRGWHLGRDLDHTLTLTALRRALARYPAPEIHHSDQGVQYAATVYTDVLQAAQVQISMAEQGEAWQNGYAERLIRTIKEEEVDLSEYLDYHDAYRQLGRFLDDVYAHKRIHSSLGYLTPAEFEAQWRDEHVLALEMELENA